MAREALQPAVIHPGRSNPSRLQRRTRRTDSAGWRNEALPDSAGPSPPLREDQHRARYPHRTSHAPALDACFDDSEFSVRTADFRAEPIRQGHDGIRVANVDSGEDHRRRQANRRRAQPRRSSDRLEGNYLGLSEDEIAFYDALETNHSAVHVRETKRSRRSGENWSPPCAAMPALTGP